MRISPLFRGLFDDAALFPPGNAPMPVAVADHCQHRHCEHADLVGLFVCPASRLAEAAEQLATQTGPPAAEPLPVAITVAGGPAGLADALEQAGRLACIRAAAVELPVPVAELPDRLEQLAKLAADGVTVFIEVPVAELDGTVAGSLAEAGLGLKLRTGGTTAEAFPSTAELGAAIATAAGSQVRFKCTAGLHNALAHTDPITGFAHHGFLNVLLAVAAAQAGRGGDDLALLLAEPAADRLVQLVDGLGTAEIAGLREQFRSIGSCSIAEPLTDLRNLALVGVV